VYAKLLSPEALLLTQNAPQTVWQLGSAGPAGGAYSTPTDLLAGVKVWGSQEGEGRMVRTTQVG